MSDARLRLWLLALGLATALPGHAEPTITTEVLHLRFDGQGRLLEAVACLPDCADSAARRESLNNPQGLVSFTDTGDGRWTARASEKRGERVLTFAGPGGREVRWSVAARSFGLGLAVSGVGDVVLQSGETLRPRGAAGFASWLEQIRYVLIDTERARQYGLDETGAEAVRGEWAGYRSRFWTLLVSADRPSRFEFTAADTTSALHVVRRSAGDDERLLLYFGPVEPRALAEVDLLLRKLMYAGLWFWLRWICFGLFYLLLAIHQLVPVWGAAIMLLSVAVNVLMAPLSRAADRLQAQVHATETRLAPELARIKREFRGEEQAAQIIALYRAERVHPLYSLKSLMGIAIVIPVFVGAFDMLAENIHLLGTPFLWIDDLSHPDGFSALPFTLPFFGNQLNVLPFLMTAFSVLASILHRPLAQHPDLRRRQLRNMVLLAVVFFVLFYTFPAGMVLYWTTNNLIAAGKGLWHRYFGVPYPAGQRTASR